MKYLLLAFCLWVMKGLIDTKIDDISWVTLIITVLFICIFWMIIKIKETAEDESPFYEESMLKD